MYLFYILFWLRLFHRLRFRQPGDYVSKPTEERHPDIHNRCHTGLHFVEVYRRGSDLCHHR
jgi:hypothetical protein